MKTGHLERKTLDMEAATIWGQSCGRCPVGAEGSSRWQTQHPRYDLLSGQCHQLSPCRKVISLPIHNVEVKMTTQQVSFKDFLSKGRQDINLNVMYPVCQCAHLLSSSLPPYLPFFNSCPCVSSELHAAQGSQCNEGGQQRGSNIYNLTNEVDKEQ